MQMQLPEGYLVIAIHQQEKLQMERNMNFSANKLLPINPVTMFFNQVYIAFHIYVMKNNY